MKIRGVIRSVRTPRKQFVLWWEVFCFVLRSQNQFVVCAENAHTTKAARRDGIRGVRPLRGRTHHESVPGRRAWVRRWKNQHANRDYVRRRLRTFGPCRVGGGKVANNANSRDRRDVGQTNATARNFCQSGRHSPKKWFPPGGPVS